MARRRRKHDEEFKQQALSMARNGCSPRSVAESLGISEPMFHRWKRAPRALPEAAGDEIECIYGDQRSYSGRRMTNN